MKILLFLIPILFLGIFTLPLLALGDDFNRIPMDKSDLMPKSPRSLSATHVNGIQEAKQMAKSDKCEVFKNVDGGFDVICGPKIDDMAVLVSYSE